MAQDLVEKPHRSFLYKQNALLPAAREDPADGPIPSDTDLRSFAMEYFASYFRDEDIPREVRLPKVRQLESEFFAVSGRALWKLVLKRTDEFADEDHFTAAFYESYKIDYLDEFLRRYGAVVYPDEWLEACRCEY